MKTRTEVFDGNQFAVIASRLEGLLYHRLGREWSERSDLSSLLEQSQLSQCLGIPIYFSDGISGVADKS
jgi:hypothetical protein